jgi:uncharacterized protein (TIGR02679 family)
VTDPAHDPDWGRLLRAARRNLERTGGSLAATVSLPAPTDEERRLVIGVTGVHRTLAAGRLTVRLMDLDVYLRAAYGRGLASVAAEAGGGVLRDRPAERVAAATARAASLELAAASRHAEAEWYVSWLDSVRRDGTLTRLVRGGAGLATVVRVLDALPASNVPLPAFAETVLGDTKALGDATLRGVTLRAVAIWQNQDPPVNAEDERALWESVGVVPDDLASQVLVLNLPASGGLVGEWLCSAAGAGVPVRLTLHQLRLAPLTLRPTSIFVTENPAVLRAACAAMGAAAPAMVCTEGVPSAATHALLRCSPDGTLWWRNDFDWPGVRMTAAALARYPHARPWRMGTADYAPFCAAGPPLGDRPAGTPWEPALADHMSEAGVAVMEERLLPLLLEDLRAAAGRPHPGSPRPGSSVLGDR